MSENQRTPASQKNMECIAAWVDAMNRADNEGALACWQPEGEMFQVPTSKTTVTAQLREVGSEIASVLKGQSLQRRKQIVHLDAGEDWAVVEYDVISTIKGPITIAGVSILPPGITRSGVTRACLVFEMKDGKIDRAREYFDKSSMAQQLGLDQAGFAKMMSALGYKGA